MMSMSDILDIEPILFDVWMTRLPLILCGLLTSVLFLMAMRFLWNRFKRKKVKTPYQIAKAALALLHHDAQSEEDTSIFYWQLTETLKRFVTQERAVDIVDKTTEEILALSSFWNLWKATHQDTLKDFLTRSDQAKFAKMPIHPNQKQSDVILVESLVDDLWRTET